jgi:hypothetical protein
MMLQIDAQLESSSILWAQIEVVFDTVLQRADYVAQLVDFTKNPRLMARFQVGWYEGCVWWGCQYQSSLPVAAHVSPIRRG